MLTLKIYTLHGISMTIDNCTKALKLIYSVKESTLINLT